MVVQGDPPHPPSAQENRADIKTNQHERLRRRFFRRRTAKPSVREKPSHMTTTTTIAMATPPEHYICTGWNGRHCWVECLKFKELSETLRLSDPENRRPRLHADVRPENPILDIRSFACSSSVSSFRFLGYFNFICVQCGAPSIRTAERVPYVETKTSTRFMLDGTLSSFSSSSSLCSWRIASDACPIYAKVLIIIPTSHVRNAHE